MNETAKSAERFKAFKIGALCITSYLASYVMRNILSVSTPQMLEGGGFTKSRLGLISSVYFFVYALGQLVNGAIGDRVRARSMVGTGLVLSALAAFIFPYSSHAAAQTACFALNGFGLSMLRGPLMRVISENTLPKYARNCCVGFSVASFLGPLAAGVLAAALSWRAVFMTVSAVTFAMGAASFLILTYFENHGIIIKRTAHEERQRIGLTAIFSLKGFLLYMFVGALTEIVGSSVSFWIPSYISEYLRFSPSESSMIYSVISVLKAFSPFLCMFIFTKLGENEMLLMKIMFFVSAAAFAAMNFSANMWFCLAVLLVALTAAGCASTVLWSIYIPSLRDSGCVSSANGFLDFSGYIAASAANMFFADTAQTMGWKTLVVIWAALMFAGGAAVVGYSIKRRVVNNA